MSWNQNWSLLQCTVNSTSKKAVKKFVTVTSHRPLPRVATADLTKQPWAWRCSDRMCLDFIERVWQLSLQTGHWPDNGNVTRSVVAEHVMKAHVEGGARAPHIFQSTRRTVRRNTAKCPELMDAKPLNAATRTDSVSVNVNGHRRAYGDLQRFILSQWKQVHALHTPF